MFKGLRGYFIGFAILIIAASIYRLAQPTPLIYDAIEYEFAARNLIHHNILYSGDLEMPIDYRLYSKRTIGYPFFQIFQTNQKAVIILAQMFLLLFNFIVGLNILKSLNTRRLGYIMFCWFMLLTPVLLIHSQLLLADLGLMTCITTLALVLVGYKTERKTKFYLISILMTLAVLVKPVILPSLLFLIVAFIYYALKYRKFYFSFWLPIISVLALSLINGSKSGINEYSSISTINIAQYNAKLTIANQYGFDSAQQFSNSVNYFIPRNKEAYTLYKDQVSEAGYHAILDNLTAYLKVHLLGSFKMILDPGRFELYTFFGESTSDVSLTEMLFAKKWNELSRHLNANKPLFLLYALLLIISVFKLIGGFNSLLKRDKKIWILAAICIYFLAITGPIGAARFFLPCTVIFGVLSSTGWVSLLNLFKKRSKS
jgi:hypothetical protein